MYASHNTLISTGNRTEDWTSGIGDPGVVHLYSSWVHFELLQGLTIEDDSISRADMLLTQVNHLHRNNCKPKGPEKTAPKPKCPCGDDANWESNWESDDSGADQTFRPEKDDMVEAEMAGPEEDGTGKGKGERDGPFYMPLEEEGDEEEMEDDDNDRERTRANAMRGMAKARLEAVDPLFCLAVVGGRPTAEKSASSRLTDSQRQKLLEYECDCNQESGTDCHAVLSGGWGFEVRKIVWGVSQKERKERMRKDMTNALVYDETTGSAAFQFTINRRRVCEKTWLKAFAYSKTVFAATKKQLIREFNDGEHSGTVHIKTGKYEGVAEPVGRGDSIQMRTARAYFSSNAIAVGDKMPMASGKLMRFNEKVLRQKEKIGDKKRELRAEIAAARRKISTDNPTLQRREINRLVAEEIAEIKESHEDEAILRMVLDENDDDQCPVAPSNEELGRQDVVEGDMRFRDNGDTFIDENDAECQIRLPQVNRLDVYGEYVDFCDRECHMFGAISASAFMALWRNEFGYVKTSRPKGTHAMCQTCATYTSSMKKAASDPEYQHIKTLRTAHYQLQRDQRKTYYQNRTDAMMNKSKTMSLIADGMDQGKTQLPLMQRRQKNDKVTLMKQKLMGVMVHGHGTFVYVSHPPLINGANFTIECIWRTLLKMQDIYDANPSISWPPEIRFQMDNASDNKAGVFFSFFSELVERGIFERIRYNFLLVGHTHEDIDQYFSVIAQHFSTLVYHDNIESVVSFEDFQAEVQKAFVNAKMAPKVYIVIRRS